MNRSTPTRLLLSLLLLSSSALVLGCGRTELSGEPDPSTQRTIGQGDVVGFVHETGAHAWLGIPFAKPPVGELRWRAPRPPEPFEEPLEAVRFGPSCPQFAPPGGARDGADSGETTGDEDCLHLNVFAPAFAADGVPRGEARLPVMVWIHGGGNTIGDAVIYDGSRLAAGNDVVVVTVHYRLGVFGWFSHPSLRGEDTSADDRSGNYGTLDLVRALEWVERNAASFGGDPRNVTIFGESAGGSNVFSLLLSPRAAGLFHRGIVQSGGLGTVTQAEAENWSDDPEPGHEKSSREVLAHLLVADGRAADRAEARLVLAAMPPGEVAAYLRGKEAAEVLGAFSGDRLGGMYTAPRLLRDGRVLPEADPMQALRAGFYNRVPVMLGTNAHENRLFAMFASPHVGRVFGLPFRMKDLRRYELESDYPTMMWKSRGVDAPASAMRAVQGPSVFAYRFDWDESPRFLWLDVGELMGAAHGLEIPFVFGRLRFFGFQRPVFSPDREEEDMVLSRAMMSYWASFAASGDPGRGRGGRLSRWNAWSNDGGPRLAVFDSEDDGGIRMEETLVTRESVIAAVREDDRFASDEERCVVYGLFVSRGDGMSRDEYDAALGGRCKDVPLLD